MRAWITRQRTNKFAHHVVLDPRELVPGGPAWLLAAPGFMQSTWDGVPKVLPAGRRPPAANSAAAICRAWQQMTGDAGWGGALAETAMPGASRPAVIIFRPGIDPLSLLAESLALLPPESRWNVSFSTYFNKLPPGIECQWRCVLEGSPEAIANQRMPGALVIDLGKPLGAAPASPLVEAARTGILPMAPAARPQRVAATVGPAPAAGPSPAAAAPERGPMQVAAPPVVAPPVSTTVETGEYDLAQLDALEGPLDIEPQAVAHGFKRKPKSQWPLFAGLAAGIVILVAAAAAFWATQRSPRVPDHVVKHDDQRRPRKQSQGATTGPVVSRRLRVVIHCRATQVRERRARVRCRLWTNTRREQRQRTRPAAKHRNPRPIIRVRRTAPVRPPRQRLILQARSPNRASCSRRELESLPRPTHCAGRRTFHRRIPSCLRSRRHSTASRPASNLPPFDQEVSGGTVTIGRGDWYVRGQCKANLVRSDGFFGEGGRLRSDQ